MTSQDGTNLANKTIQSWLETLPVRPTLTVLAVLVSAAVGLGVAVHMLTSYAKGRTGEIAAGQRHFAEVETELSLEALASGPVSDRINLQLAEIRASAHYHLRLGNEFFVSQYMSVTIATFCATAAGLLLVPISWNGWKRSKLLLTLPFFVFAGTAVFFTTFNQLFSQEENFIVNTRLYFDYLNLEDEILSYYAWQTTDDDKAPKPHTFMKSIDQRLVKMRSLGVTIDANSIPQYQQVFEGASRALDGSRSPTPP